ncbi:hypothetical protein MCBRY_000381 [Methylocystis bryophila]
MQVIRRPATGVHRGNLIATRRARVLSLRRGFQERHAAQSVTIRPGTRSNSRRLSVTSAAPRRRACAATR